MIIRLLSTFALLVMLAPVGLAMDVQESPLTIGKTFTFESRVMGDEREVNVWLPPDYPERADPPVVFLMDGGVEQDFHHISGLAQLGSINLLLEVPIVVGIRTGDRFNELTSKPEDPRYIREPAVAGGIDRFTRFIRDEVKPLVATRFPSNGRTVVMGESLAGLFVLQTFLESPQLFDDYISVSPSLWWDDKALAKRAKELLAEHGKSERRLYMTMADEGGTMRGGMDIVLAALEEDSPAGLKWTWVDRSDRHTHASIYHPAAMDALGWLYGVPEVHESDEMPWYLIEGGQPPEDPGSP